ncbi:hormone-sensitive lipase [Microdochium nivale]|nr:hormone-sensitive lipase [Microdochium nivale]
MNTATVSMAVTPTVLSTFVNHYLNRKPLHQRPTAHLSYDEGLHLIRSFLRFASHHSVEDLQAFTAQWVPHPRWVKLEDVEIPEAKLDEAAAALIKQLGPDGLRKVGGKNWWQWRRPGRPLAAEWIEMKADYNERKRSGTPSNRVMLYVHGGAYYFGSVGEHRYQMQRHARKLKARVFAPEYRLAPQFPFPCGLQDCLAAYLYLLTIQDPNTIVLAGDSAGGGMVVSLLVIMRDQGIPLPAGAVLISPWVDLTHSFPSLSGDAPMDYIPSYGFHHKPSAAWPPLNADQHELLKQQVAKQAQSGQSKPKKLASAEIKDLAQDLQSLGDSKSADDTTVPSFLKINLDGKDIELKDQIQLYTTNELLNHPLVSPVMQPTLGGLPPLLIMTGGGEILRDEQVYLAHKCANPAKYALPDAQMDDAAREQLARYKPTDVQLQLWEDMCHVGPTLSFTRPAKFMFRSVAQFGAWALARAQKIEIEILDDDDISIISSSGESDEDARKPKEGAEPAADGTDGSLLVSAVTVGKAGDPLPAFKRHMIRQRVDRHGRISVMEPEAEIEACNLAPESIGMVKEGPVRKWLDIRREWDTRFGNASAKVHKKRLKELVAGYELFEGEHPPPSSMAARRRAGEKVSDKRRKKSMGLALWSLWGSKHDEQTVIREEQADKSPEVKVASEVEGQGARSPSDLERQTEAAEGRQRSKSKSRVVKDENQTGFAHEASDINEKTVPTIPGAQRTQVDGEEQDQSFSGSGANGRPLTPDNHSPELGVTGKRPKVGGIAVPFTLKKEADTASMITLTSHADGPFAVSPLPPPEGIKDAEIDPLARPENLYTSAAAAAAVNERAMDEVAQPEEVKKDNTTGSEYKTIEQTQASVEQTSALGSAVPEPVAAPVTKSTADVEDSDDAETPKATAEPLATPASEYFGVPVMQAGVVVQGGSERPPLESFTTAQEDLPMAK